MNTTQTKHTPGPWLTQQLNYKFADGCETYQLIVTPSTNQTCIARINCSLVEHKQNAALIAGSAELLDAAKALSHAYLDAEPVKAKADAWMRLRAAIRAAS